MLNIKTPIRLLMILVLSICFSALTNIDNCSLANTNLSTIKLINKSYTQNSSRFNIPQIIGMKDEKIQTLINKNIKMELISPFLPADPKSSMDGISKIVFQNGRLLVLQYDGLYMWPEAPHPSKINQGINIDLTTGKIYSLSDLFNAKINYKQELKKLIKSHENKYRFKVNETGYYNHFTYEDFVDNFGDVQFVMHKDYLHLYYEGIYAIGAVAGYKIPYKDIMGLINQNGNLWKAFENIN